MIIDTENVEDASVGGIDGREVPPLALPADEIRSPHDRRHTEFVRAFRRLERDGVLGDVDTALAESFDLLWVLVVVGRRDDVGVARLFDDAVDAVANLRHRDAGSLFDESLGLLDRVTVRGLVVLLERLDICELALAGNV